MTDGVGNARDLWSEAPRFCYSRTISSSRSGRKGFRKNAVPTGIGCTVVPDMMTMFICGCRRRA